MLSRETGERVIVEQRGDVRAQEGALARIGFEPDRVHLFDKATEKRLR
jgi:lactose/L-arabinose transport system ATP-binding protein